MSPPLRVLLLGGVETRFHQFELVVPPLVEQLEQRGHSVTSATPDQALNEAMLKHTDVVVSITTGGTLGDAEWLALDRAVSTSANDAHAPVHFLGLHGASCSFDGHDAYTRFLGGRFLSHPAMARFRVEPDPVHPVTRAVAPFEVFDERYVLDIRPDVEPVLFAGGAPLGWVRRHGAGKVCYLALGHGPEQLSHPSVDLLLLGALSWFLELEARAPTSHTPLARLARSR